MIHVVCFNCDEELTEPGGLLFSPPKSEVCVKYHLCARCYALVLAWLAGMRES